MAGKKPRLQFTEDSGSAADSKIRKPAQPKLLTDEQKAKARKEQLRFGKKENAAPIDLNTRSSSSRRGVVKHDILPARATSVLTNREATEAIRTRMLVRRHSRRELPRLRAASGKSAMPDTAINSRRLKRLRSWKRKRIRQILKPGIGRLWIKQMQSHPIPSPGGSKGEKSARNTTKPRMLHRMQPVQ